MSQWDLQGDDEAFHSSHRWKQRRSTEGRTSYKYCRSHRRIEKTSSRCFREVERPGASAAVHTFRPFWNSVMDSKPIFIESKAQYRRECAARNQVCPL